MQKCQIVLSLFKKDVKRNISMRWREFMGKYQFSSEELAGFCEQVCIVLKSGIGLEDAVKKQLSRGRDKLKARLKL